jgi:aspartyl/asparaginyl-tRNA synthetase
MTEFIQVDVEAGFIEFSDLLQISSNVIHAAVSAVWSKCQDQLKLWGATKPRLPKILPTITLNEVHEKYSKATKQSTIGEEDLRPDEERWITDWSAKELDSEAIFVVDWPASGAKFYHRLKQDDPKTAERADLIFRGVEIATASMREHRYDKLISQFKKAGIDYNHPGFKHYLMAFKYGLPPHGGFGLGLERLTSKIVGLANVKEASLFPRDINRLMP